MVGKEKTPLVGSYTFPSERKPLDGSPQFLQAIAQEHAVEKKVVYGGTCA